MAAQRIPAWQRLGLKLKSAGSPSEALSTPSAPDAPFQRDNFESPKRKFQNFGDSPAARPSLKRPRTDDRQFGTPLQRHKSVSFEGGGDNGEQVAAVSRKAKTTPKKKKGPKISKPQGPISSPDLTVALDYLRRWKTSRDSWKFNKNHQTQLINHVFNPTLVPAADVDTFYEYIGDIKGYIKTRLLEAAKAITTTDMEDKKDHFPEGTADVESKEKQYEEMMSVILRRSESAPKRKAFNEMDYSDSAVDPAVALRVAKRMRAEIILEELHSESDESEAATTTTTTTAGEMEEDEKESSPAKEASEEPDAGKRVKLNDGTTRPVKRVRASKRRGADQDSSSDESDSDSDSDGDGESDNESESGSGSDSSDSSDSSDDSDGEMDVDDAAGPNEQDTSSSSASSSDEDADEDEDSDDD